MDQDERMAVLSRAEAIEVFVAHREIVETGAIGSLEDLSPELESWVASEALELLTSRHGDTESGILSKAEAYGRALALAKVLHDVGADTEAERAERRAMAAWSEVDDLDDGFFAKGRAEQKTRFLSQVAGVLRRAAGPRNRVPNIAGGGS
jgi:hypothetical protein